MRHATLTLALWMAACGLASAQGMYSPVVDECQPGCGVPYCDFGCTAPEWYAGFRVGFFQQSRGDLFEFGTVANNPTGTSPYILNTPSFGLTDWAASPEVHFGVVLSDPWAVEGRFLYARFDITDDYQQQAINDPTVQLYMPFLDARPAPQPAGVAGVGMRQGLVGFSYQSDYYDWGVDLVHRWIDDGERRLELVVGAAFSQISQKFSHFAAGQSGVNLDEQRQSQVTEDIDEWFYGSRLGLRGRRALLARLDLEAETNLYLFGHHASLSGYQFNVAKDADGANLFSPLSVVIRDRQCNFVPRLDFLLGFRLRITDHLTATLAYRFAYWAEVAGVDNPGLILNGAWIGEHSARLDDEDLIQQSFLGGLTWEY